MKRTLLELTQDILASLNGDEVTSINDSTESKDVATTIRTVFYEIASQAKLPEHYTLFQLEETSVSTPTVMTKPTDIITIDWIKYNNQLLTDTASNYQFVDFYENSQFLDLLHRMDTEESDSVDRFDYTISGNTFVFPYGTNKYPSFYSSYNDNVIIFDSIDWEQEDFLRKTNTMGYGLKESSWTHSDSFVPPLDHKLFNLLYQTAKAQCFVDFKQIENASAERKSRRGWLTLIKEKNDVTEAQGGYYNSKQLPNYGRK